MLEQVVYISSDMRSGSTMLDLLLGNHSLITSLGEVNHIQAYAKNSRKLYNPSFPLKCMCGEAFENCPFWTEVQTKLPIPFANLKTRMQFDYDNRVLNIANKINIRIIHALRDYFPSLLNNRLILASLGYIKNSLNRFLLYEAVAQAVGTPIIVDSSKHPVRFKSLYFCNPQKLRVILLYRDPKDVVYSKMKRGDSLKQAAAFWVRRSRLMWTYSKFIPKNQIILLKYEDICVNPEREMKKICNFLDIQYESRMATLDKAQKHMLGGSPSKNDASDTKIKPRTEAASNLSEKQIKKIYNLTAKYAKKLGYIEG